MIKEVGAFAIVLAIVFAYFFWGTYFGWHHPGGAWICQKLDNILTGWFAILLLPIRLTYSFFVGVFGGGIIQFLKLRGMIKVQESLSTQKAYTS